jgi:quercetin dioxygenase-like cupin family protein
MNDPTASGGSSRVELLRRSVPGQGDLEAVLLQITFPPGYAAPAHTHPCIGVGYVLEGIYESQYQGEPLRRFAAGDAIYDLAGTTHLIARNSSATQPMRFLMTFIVKRGQPTIEPM